VEPTVTDCEKGGVTIWGAMDEALEEVPAMESVMTVVGPAPSALVALASRVYIPAVVGVPEMTPVEELSESPAGRPVTL
jgi:precorrin isomerase